jgi:hypothetical protein
MGCGPVRIPPCWTTHGCRNGPATPGNDSLSNGTNLRRHLALPFWNIFQRFVFHQMPLFFSYDNDLARKRATGLIGVTGAQLYVLHSPSFWALAIIAFGVVFFLFRDA